jgi:putative CocE/NonD family hydrolase
MPWSRGNSPLSLAPEYEEYLFDQWEHGSFDGYWKQLGIYAQGFYKEYSDAAMTIISSWYDVYTRTATENYMGLSKIKRGPVRLILGPWTHGDREQTFSGEVDFGSAAAFSGNVSGNYLLMKLRWFDRYLKGAKNGVDTEPAVRLFVMGGGSGRRNPEGRMDHGGRWRTETDWPIARTRYTPFYLQADGTLSGKKPQTDVPAKVYHYDPRNPVPTIGGAITSGQPIMVGGAFDQREGARFYGSRQPYKALAERPDILVFQTPLLTSDIEITGPIAAILWIASDCPDTDFTVKLIDVYPPNEDYPEGFAMNLTDGILRCRYRDSWEHPRLMQAGRTYRIKIEAFPTSNLFKAGHRIRVDISSSNFPHFDANSNTGEPEGKATALRMATNRVFVDRRRASHVILPIIP